MLFRSPDKLPFVFQKQSIFVAGGISNCPDWQSDIVALIDQNIHDVINPRRVGGFDPTGDTAEDQITWEHRALSLVDACIFWFPKETLCPITLLEFGRMVERAAKHNVRLAIGWHPEYQRAFDLTVQLKLEHITPDYILHAAAGWSELCAVVKNTWG